MNTQRILLATAFVAAISTYLGLAAAGKPPSKPKWSGYDAPEGLELTIDSETKAVSEPGDITLSWELENRTGAPLYVCQWPGITCQPHYTAPDGVIHGVISGYPDSQPLPRKYFVELKPGEALFGMARAYVHRTPDGKIRVNCEYRSDQTGERFSLDGWKGRVTSNSVELSVPEGEP